MAAAALVAISDGDASIEEGAEVGRLMRVLNLLRDHEPDHGVQRYLHYVSLLRRDAAAFDTVRAVVRNAAEDEEAAALLLVISHAISEADGIVRDVELEEIRTLGLLLGIDPKDAVERVAPTSRVHQPKAN